MATNTYLKLMPHELPRLNQSIEPIFLVLLSVALVGCSKTESPKEITATSAPEMLPVLEVKQAEYTFSMYPQFETERQSRLKLDIRDTSGKFIRGANVGATLVANDGHQQQAVFEEDSRLQRYTVQIPLTHHEDYVIDTSIEFKESGRTFAPKFSFHCCDPIPELLNEDTSLERQGGSPK